MKELEQNKPILETVISQEKQQEFKLLGNYRKVIDSGKIFVIDNETGAVTPASYKKDEVYGASKPTRDQLVIEKGKTYIEAMNAQTAVKRAKKGKIIIKT